MANGLQQPGLVRQGGQLRQQTQESLQQLAQRQGQPTPPPSPAAAKPLGATPDQAKMAGTPAAKAGARLQQTRAGTQRVEAPRMGATEAETLAQLRGERLQKLSELGPSVQALIDQRLQTLAQQQAQLGVSEEALQQAGLTAEQQTAATQALQNFIQTGDQAALKEVAAQLGVEATSPDQLQQYITGPIEALTAVANQVSPDQLTLADLDLTQVTPDINQLAADLGLTPEQLQGLTVDQLQEQIDAVQQQAFSRIAELQAELPNAAPNRAQQIREELRDLGAVGVTGLEDSFQRLESQLDTADTIEIGGQDYALQEILQDDAISSLIEEAALSPERLAELEKTEPALAQWIKDNQAALQDVLEAREATGVAFRETQAQYSEFKDDPLAAMILGELPEFATSEEFAALQTQLQDQPLYKVAQDIPEVRTALTENPQLAETLKTWSEDELREAATLTDTLRNSELLQSLGFELPASGLLTDKTTIQSIQEAAEIINTLPPIIQSDAVQFVKDGLLDLDDLDRLGDMDNPQYAWDNAKASFEKTKQFQDLLTTTTPTGKVVPKSAQEQQDAIEQFLFGKDIPHANNINLRIGLLEKLGQTAEANELRAMFDTNKDGRVDQSELTALTSKVKQLMQPGDVGDWIGKETPAPEAAISDKIKALLQQPTSQLTSLVEEQEEIAAREAATAAEKRKLERATSTLAKSIKTAGIEVNEQGIVTSTPKSVYGEAANAYGRLKWLSDIFTSPKTDMAHRQKVGKDIRATAAKLKNELPQAKKNADAASKALRALNDALRIYQKGTPEYEAANVNKQQMQDIVNYYDTLKNYTTNISGAVKNLLG